MDHSIKTGLLGFGLSGRVFHVPFIQTHPGFKLHSVTERNNKNAKYTYPDIRSYESTAQLIHDRERELIVINTSNNTHFEYAKQALESRKHVLVEKPFTTTLSEAQELFKLGKKVRRKVMAYQNRRWDSDFQSVKDVVESGKLGKLVEAHFRFDRYNIDPASKTLKIPPTGSGIVYGLVPHLLDQAICLFGKPLRSLKTTGSNRHGSVLDDFAFLHLIYPDNLNVFLYTSLLVAKPLPAFVIHGTEGSYIKDRTDVQEKQLDRGIIPSDKNYGLEMPGTEGELTLVDDRGRKKTEYLTSLKGDYTQLYEAAYQHIRNNQSFPIKNEHILWQMELIEQQNV